LQKSKEFMNKELRLPPSTKTTIKPDSFRDLVLWKQVEEKAESKVVVNVEKLISDASALLDRVEILLINSIFRLKMPAKHKVASAVDSSNMPKC
jgi:hypothetical protein